MTERGRDQAPEQLFINDLRALASERRQPHDGRDDCGRRIETLRTDVEQCLDRKMAAQHDAEPAVRFAARFGRHALHHFFLQHEIHVADAVAAFDQVKQQRRRDVVGQVADDAQGIAERTEVELQRVGFVNAHVVSTREAMAQGARQVAVEFHAMQMPGFPRERFGDGARAGTDLDDRVAGLRIDRLHDGVDNAGVGEEVLPEALAGAMPVHRVCESVAAMWTAANRLPASALPVPARSNAVP